jgi:hypothetical protein
MTTSTTEPEDQASAGEESLLEGSADVAQLVEHSLGKGEVTSSILVIGSRVSVFGRSGNVEDGRWGYTAPGSFSRSHFPSRERIRGQAAWNSLINGSDERAGVTQW